MLAHSGRRTLSFPPGKGALSSCISNAPAAILGTRSAAACSKYKLDTNPPRAARTYALTFAACVACWQAKYHYLVGRPIHFDPTIDTLWTTYAVAAYPSGHSCNLTAPATVLGYLFPSDAHYFLSRAEENAASRRRAGIHFRRYVVAGVALGQEVGKALIEYAEADGIS